MKGGLIHEVNAQFVAVANKPYLHKLYIYIFVCSYDEEATPPFRRLKWCNDCDEKYIQLCVIITFS